MYCMQTETPGWITYAIGKSVYSEALHDKQFMMHTAQLADEFFVVCMLYECSLIRQWQSNLRNFTGYRYKLMFTVKHQNGQ